MAEIGANLIPKFSLMKLILVQLRLLVANLRVRLTPAISILTKPESGGENWAIYPNTETALVFYALIAKIAGILARFISIVLCLNLFTASFQINPLEDGPRAIPR